MEKHQVKKHGEKKHGLKKRRFGFVLLILIAVLSMAPQKGILWQSAGGLTEQAVEAMERKSVMLLVRLGRNEHLPPDVRAYATDAIETLMALQTEEARAVTARYLLILESRPTEEAGW